MSFIGKWLRSRSSKATTPKKKKNGTKGAGASAASAARADSPWKFIDTDEERRISDEENMKITSSVLTSSFFELNLSQVKNDDLLNYQKNVRNTENIHSKALSPLFVILKPFSGIF